MENIINLIKEERLRQDAKWGADRHQADSLWSLILLEEVGEVARAILNRDRANLKTELIQVAAVAVAWLEDLFRN